MNNNKSAAKVNNGEFTGSISKVLAIKPEDQCILKRVEFGNATNPASSFSPTSIIENIEIAPGTYLEGPIGAISGSNIMLFLNK